MLWRQYAAWLTALVRLFCTLLHKLHLRTARWVRRCLTAVMRSGSVPRHVALIMDGNRRFADHHRLDRTAGHVHGYTKLLDALEWCLELGITCVSVYAFSIENFKRSPEEVQMLMALAEEKLVQAMQEQEVAARHGVQVRVIGDLQLLPPGVQRAAQRVMAATRHHTRGILNICVAYTSTEEMGHAVAAVQAEVASGRQMPEDITLSTIDRFLYTEGCPPVDLLIRTSGETRLSNFLLPQSAHAALVFTPVLWPDFSFLDLLKALAAFHRVAPALAHLRAAAQLAPPCSSGDALAARGIEGTGCTAHGNVGGCVGAALSAGVEDSWDISKGYEQPHVPNAQTDSGSKHARDGAAAAGHDHRRSWMQRQAHAKGVATAE